VLAILYDIHGNLPALEAVLAESKKKGIKDYLLGGDYGTPSPWPHETLKLLRALPNTTWIRGNGERWLREPPELPPHIADMIKESYRDFLKDFPKEEIETLYDLPIQKELDGVLYVHGSPKSDVESFHREQKEGEEEMLAGVHDKTVVFGHSHQQFQRPGLNKTYLVNPGSVGMPLDGDRRAAWAIRTDDGNFEFQRTDYDWQKSADAFRDSAKGELSQWLYNRIKNGKD
jgi:predicted phosphodiesterase